MYLGHTKGMDLSPSLCPLGASLVRDVLMSISLILMCITGA